MSGCVEQDDNDRSRAVVTQEEEEEKERPRSASKLAGLRRCRGLQTVGSLVARAWAGGSDVGWRTLQAACAAP